MAMTQQPTDWMSATKLLNPRRGSNVQNGGVVMEKEESIVAQDMKLSGAGGRRGI